MKKLRKYVAVALSLIMIVSAMPLELLAASTQSPVGFGTGITFNPPEGHSVTRTVIFPGHLYAAPSQSVLFFAASLNHDDEMVGVKHDVAWLVRENASFYTVIENGYLRICPNEESQRLYIIAASMCGNEIYDTTTVTLTNEALSFGGPFLRVQGEDAEVLLEAVMDEFFSDLGCCHDGNIGAQENVLLGEMGFSQINPSAMTEVIDGVVFEVVSVTDEAELRGAIFATVPTIIEIDRDITLTTLIVPNGTLAIPGNRNLIIRGIVDTSNNPFIPSIIATGNFNAISITQTTSLTLEGISVTRLYGTVGRGINNFGHLTIIGGSIHGHHSMLDAGGGGINNFASGRFHMRGDAVISGNSALNGGGIANTGRFYMHDNSQISNNAAIGEGAGNGHGGGLFNTGSASFIFNSGLIYENSARNAGGGLFNGITATMRMYGGEITRNIATANGGGINNTGSAYIRMLGGRIHENTATLNGGGVGNTMDAEFHMEGNAVIEGNIARSGGGVSNLSAFFMWENATISGNFAIPVDVGGNGGGVINSTPNAVFTMENGTIGNNEARSGGGMFMNEDSTFIMRGGQIINNTAHNNGGGIHITMVMLMTGSLNISNGAVFSGNQARTMSISEDCPNICNTANIPHYPNVQWSHGFECGLNNADIFDSNQLFSVRPRNNHAFASITIDDVVDEIHVVHVYNAGENPVFVNVDISYNGITAFVLQNQAGYIQPGFPLTPFKFEIMPEQGLPQGNYTAVVAVEIHVDGTIIRRTFNVSVTVQPRTINFNPPSMVVATGGLHHIVEAIFTPCDFSTPHVDWEIRNREYAEYAEVNIFDSTSVAIIPGDRAGRMVLFAESRCHCGVSGEIEVILYTPVDNVTMCLYNPNMVMGQPSAVQQLTANFVDHYYPDYCEFSKGNNLRQFRWRSSNPSVATVDELTGEVTAVGRGETTITVQARFGENLNMESYLPTDSPWPSASAEIRVVETPENLRIIADDLPIHNGILMLPRELTPISLEADILYEPPLERPRAEWAVVHPAGTLPENYIASISPAIGEPATLSIYDTAGSAEIVLRAYCEILGFVGEYRLPLIVYTPVESVEINRVGDGILRVDDTCGVYVVLVYPECDFSDEHEYLRVWEWRTEPAGILLVEETANVHEYWQVTAVSPDTAEIFVWMRNMYGGDGFDVTEDRVEIQVLGDVTVKIDLIDTYLREGEIRNLSLDISGPRAGYVRQYANVRWRFPELYAAEYAHVVELNPTTGRIRVIGNPGQTARVYAYLYPERPWDPDWSRPISPVTITVIDAAPTVRIVRENTVFEDTEPVTINWETTPVGANPPLVTHVSVTHEVVRRTSRRILFWTTWHEELTWEPFHTSPYHTGSSISFPVYLGGASEIVYRVEVEVINDRGDRSSDFVYINVVNTGAWLDIADIELNYHNHVVGLPSREIVDNWQAGSLTLTRDLRPRLSDNFNWRAEDTLTWEIVSSDYLTIAQVQHWTIDGWRPLSANAAVSHNARIRIIGLRYGETALRVTHNRFADNPSLDGAVQYINVKVAPLPGSLHFIQTNPVLANGYAVFTDAAGDVHYTQISGDMRDFALYHPYGIYGYIDIMGISMGGEPYFGAVHTGRLTSASHEREIPYTFNLVPLRRASRQRFIINTPDGQPFNGGVHVSGGVLLNRDVVGEPLVFENPVFTLANGVLDIEMDSNAFDQAINEVAAKVAGDPTHQPLLEFVFELRFEGTNYAPQLIFSRGFVSGRSHFDFNDTIVTLQEWPERRGFIDVRYLYDSWRYGDPASPVGFREYRWEDISDVTGYIGPTTAWPFARLTTIFATRAGTGLSGLRYVNLDENKPCPVTGTHYRFGRYDWSFLQDSPYDYWWLELDVKNTQPAANPPTLTIGIPQAEGWHYVIYGNFDDGNLQRIEMPMGVFNRIGMDIHWEEVDLTIDLSGAVTDTQSVEDAMRGNAGPPMNPDAPIRPLPDGAGQSGAGLAANALLMDALSSQPALVTRMLDRLMPAGGIDSIGFKVSYHPTQGNPLVYVVTGYWEREWGASASRDFPRSPNRVYWSTGPGGSRLHNCRNCVGLSSASGIKSGSWDDGMAWFASQNRPMPEECRWNGGCKQRWPDWHNRVIQHNANLRTIHANIPTNTPQFRGNLRAEASFEASAYFRGEIGWCIHEQRFVREITEFRLELEGEAGVSASMSIPPVRIPIPGLPVPPSVFGLRFTFEAGIEMEVEAKVRIDNNNIRNLRDMDWLAVEVEGNAYLSIQLAANLDIWIAAASVGVRARIDFDAGFATYPLTWINYPNRFDFASGMLLHGMVGIDYSVRVGPRIRIFGRRLYRTWNGWIWRTSFPIWPSDGPANWCACGAHFAPFSSSSDRCQALSYLLPENVRPRRGNAPIQRNDLSGAAQAAGAGAQGEIAPMPRPVIPTSGREQPTDTPVLQGSGQFAAIAWVSGICEYEIEAIPDDDDLSAEDLIALAGQTRITVTITQDSGANWEMKTFESPGGVASINPRVAVCDSGRIIVLWEEIVFGDGGEESIRLYDENGIYIDTHTFATFTLDDRRIRFAKFSDGEWGDDIHHLDIAAIRGEYVEIDVAINPEGAIVALSATYEAQGSSQSQSNIYLRHISRDGIIQSGVPVTSGENMSGNPSVERFGYGFVLAYFTDIFGGMGDITLRAIAPDGQIIPGFSQSLAAAVDMHGTYPTFDYRLLVQSNQVNPPYHAPDDVVITWVAFCTTLRRSVIHAALLTPIEDGNHVDFMFTSPIMLNTAFGGGDEVLSILDAYVFTESGTPAVRVLYNRIDETEFGKHTTRLMRYYELVGKIENAQNNAELTLLLDELDALLPYLDNPGITGDTIGRFRNSIDYLVYVPNLDVAPGSWLTVEITALNRGIAPVQLKVNLNGQLTEPTESLMPNEIYTWVEHVLLGNEDRLNFTFTPNFDGGGLPYFPSCAPQSGYILLALPDVSLGTVRVTRSEGGLRDITISYFSMNGNAFPPGARVYTYFYRDPLFSITYNDPRFVQPGNELPVLSFPAAYLLDGDHSITITHDVSGYIDPNPTRRVNVANPNERPVVFEEKVNERYGYEIPHAGVPIFIRTEIRDASGRVAEADLSRNTARVTIESLLRNNQPAVTAMLNRFDGQTADVSVFNRSMQSAENVRFYAQLLDANNNTVDMSPITIGSIARETVKPVEVAFNDAEARGVRVIITPEPPDVLDLLWGDVNGDDEVNLFDAVALVLWINAGSIPGAINESAARITSSTGRPDLFDAVALILWINAGGDATIGHPGPST